MPTPIATLKPGRAAPFFGRHPWVLESAIREVKPNPGPLDWVELRAENGDFVAWGAYNANSRIRMRLYSWRQDVVPDDAWFRRKLANAIELRRHLGYDVPNGACRLVNSEADGISGLIVDRFGSHLVLQPTSLGLWLRLETIAAQLQELVRPESMVVDLDSGIVKREGVIAPVTPSWGSSPEAPIEILEHGLRYSVHPGRTQKTGFYLDQRENRRAAAAHFAGRRVADICCYTGGFAICAEKLGGASEVVGLDTSNTAVDAARRHADLNGCERTRFETGDCFQWLDAAVGRGERFGGMILDPPKFAAGRKQVPNALRAYHRLNLQAVRLLEPGGILVTCRCSGSLMRDEFIEMLHGVAVRAGRAIQILEVRGAAADHPVGTHCRENEYLKCLICRVE